MSAVWMSRVSMLEALGMTEAELDWYHTNFSQQMRVLSRPGEGGELQYMSDTIQLVMGLAAMRAQGASPDQIKGWFGLAVGLQDPE